MASRGFRGCGRLFLGSACATMCLLAFLTVPLLAASSDADIAAWVEARGGLVERDSASRITGVILRAAWVTDTDLDALARIPQLKRLDLSYTHISDRGIERLKPLAAVTDLNLRYAEHVTDEGLAHLKGWKKLERLDVTGTKITDTGLEHLSAITSLVSLDAGFAEITNNGLDALTSLTNLRHLLIGGNKLSDAALHFLKQMPQLTSLDVCGSQRTDSGLWFLTLTDAGLDTVASLSNLEELNIAGTRITDVGLAKLARLAKLQSLDVSRTQVTAKGLEALAGMPKLARLSLWKAPKVGDDALPVLLRMKSLKWVDATETAMKPESLAKLPKLP